ncbi:MAG: hypothetical protein OEL83_12235 [Desulforhopalus sp.]|nr:hypothetical protein [Desulforhopalus sp.]
MKGRQFPLNFLLDEVFEVIVDGKTGNYTIRDTGKLFPLASEKPISTESRGVLAIITISRRIAGRTPGFQLL